MEEKKYYISFIHLFPLLFLLWIIIDFLMKWIFFGVVGSLIMGESLSWSVLINNLENSFYVALNFTNSGFGPLFAFIPIAIVTNFFILFSPVRMTENGFIASKREQYIRSSEYDDRTGEKRFVVTRRAVINWDDIYDAKLKKILWFQYLKIYCKYDVKKRIPLSVKNKTMFIEDLKKYVPYNNPLINHITNL